MIYPLFVSCAKGLEYLLEDELKGLGLEVTKVSPQGVYGDASLNIIYQLCLWSRIANRIQVILFSGHGANEQALYQLCHQFPWHNVFTVEKTLAIEFHGSSAQIRNTMFGAQVIKDSIVDYFRNLTGTRPSIAKEEPQVRIHAYLKNDFITLSFDVTGYSLHQRGYRNKAGEAPLKETLAAALLIRSKWPELAASGYSLHDPFCGSGTLVIEAAMIARNIAPGLLRHDQSFHHWVLHQSLLWEKLRTQALQQTKPFTGKISGSDHNQTLLNIAKNNADQAGVLDLVNLKVEQVSDSCAASAQGLLITNPPYGERLGDATQLLPLYQQLGKTLHHSFQGWQVSVLTSNPILAKAIGLRATKQYSFYNGPIECKLYCMVINSENQFKNNEQGHFSPAVQMFANRLRKNYQHLNKWTKRRQISCYRVYDADLPEYAFAIDIYNDYAVLQEYTAPSSIAVHKAEKRSLEVIQTVPIILGIDPSKLVVKQRSQQKGSKQYQKLAETTRTMIVREGPAQFKVNLYDYLDTGIFLDHRPLRLSFAQLKPGMRFLNCFCYTGTASVHAALAGALTTNVDLSNTYLTWAEDNFRLNQLDLSRHQFVKFDCLEWLRLCQDRYDVIFLDPPSFSNSKRMSTTLDIQRDHEFIVQSAMDLLNDKGTLYFSTNLRQFKLAESISTLYQVKDISHETIDEDFKRNHRIHHCFRIAKR